MILYLECVNKSPLRALKIIMEKEEHLTMFNNVDGNTIPCLCNSKTVEPYSEIKDSRSYILYYIILRITTAVMEKMKSFNVHISYVQNCPLLCPGMSFSLQNFLTLFISVGFHE